MGLLPRHIFRTKVYVVYAQDLTREVVRVPAPAGITLRMNDPRALEILAGSGDALGMKRRNREAIPEQMADGALVSGWCGEELISYGWLALKSRTLGGGLTISLAPQTAFCYRGFVRKEFRSRGVHPAALSLSCAWLRETGRRRVFVEHDDRNIASQRGIVRAGFTEIGRYRALELLGFAWPVIDSGLLADLQEVGAAIPMAPVPRPVCLT